MAAKPSTITERALQKIQDQITCGICLDPYKQPKVLKCLHFFCEQCLQPVAVREGGKSISCPTCRKVTPLPPGGVSQLQGAFFLSSLLEIQDIWGKCDRCPEHPEKESEFYCETCEQLICSHCLVPTHQGHQYDLVSKSFAKHEKVVIDSLKPVQEMITALERTIESVKSQCTAVAQQKTNVVAEIRTVFAHLRQALTMREDDLIGQAETTTQQNLDFLVVRQDTFEQQMTQLKGFLGFVEESRCTWSQGKILGMKSHLVNQANDLTSGFTPDVLDCAKQGNMKFSHGVAELMTTCQQFGKVSSPPLCPEKCRVSGKGLKIATRGKSSAATVEVLDGDGGAFLRPVDSLRCELVASHGSSRVRATVKRRDQNIYDISYQPETTGGHQLHILIEEQPILNSPFTVAVLPNFTAPPNIIGDLKKPWGIAITEEGEMVVAECTGQRVSIISINGEKKSFGVRGTNPGQFRYPEGVAIDSEGKILVADCFNHRIQQFISSGEPIKTVGKEGSKRLHLKFPEGIAVDHLTHKVYVVDIRNSRIQVLNSDLTYSSSFGGKGSDNGEFDEPRDVSVDTVGNVYVVDIYNHRIQVFSPGGEYIRQFGREGRREGELNQPVSIAIDSNNIVFVGEWGNRRLSIFTTDGEFLCFGEDQIFGDPRGIAVDKTGAVYVCDAGYSLVKKFY